MKSYKISSYNQFINESNQSIDSICKKYGIKNYTINEDGTVDVDGNIDLHFFNLVNKIPLKFGKVTGTFNCSNNILTSLEGCPYEVSEDFNCSGNELTSLEGCPEKIGGDFFCYDNVLTSLEGCTIEVGGNFWCSDNQLTSLKGCPKEVIGGFNCGSNELTSLEGAPEKVGGDFYCNKNQLTSLEGCPTNIGGAFYCYNNKITDVKGFPKIIKRNINMQYNPVYEIFKLFSQDRWVEVAEFLNEYDVIRGGNKVVLQALEVVYDELGLEVPDEIYIKGYEII